MFTRKELEAIDRNYFAVIVANDYDVTLMSKNTHHVWRLHNAEMPDGNIVVIFHKHHASDPYHFHGRCGTLNGAMREIKRHDLFQLNGRKPVVRQA
ncbi:hypothetical protein [Candidatus Weimeria sp. HCP3S3_B5]|uniref:hypothetical protein n=1 Tax=Candidatus Weimeria sp. HCP3S3_B5 TaxID=3438871 RepID=UPI003F8B8E2F